MSKNTQIGELINYISVNESGNVVLSTGQLVATQNYVGTAISNLVASAPSTLDTLNELAAALGDDPNFATTVATSIGTKQPQLNGTGFVKVTGTTVSYDNATYLTTGTAGTTYVPYTGANADVVLGTNNLKSKNTFVEGDGSYNGGGLRIKQYVSQADGIDNYNTISSQSSGFAFSSSFGGGIFKNFILDASSLTNTTQRVYTLPNATGTLALTSDIPTLTGYIPYTGATGAVDLGTNDLASKNLTAGGGVAIGGVLNLKQDAIYFVKGVGYSSIASGLSSFNFYGYTGASTSKRFRLRFDSLTDNTLRSYTLPDADGTLALTSNLSSYLPLAGGTLTGALNIRYNGGTSVDAVIRLRGTNATARTTRLQFEDYNGTIADGIIEFKIPTAGTASSATLSMGVNGAGLTFDINNTATFSNTLSVGSTIYANTGNEYLRNTAGAVNNAQFQTWFNSAGTRRGYFGYGSGGSNTLELNNESGGQVIFNGGDIIANGSYFRMKGSGDSAEFIWYKDYSGSPSQPGFVINNRAGVTTFSHNANGGGTSITGNFSSANFSGTHSGTSSGTNTGDQTNISGNASTATISYAVVGGNGGSVTLGGATDTFYPVLFGIGSGSTSKQGIAVLQIERGGYDNPGYSNYGFGTFMARFRCKADGWGYGGAYNHLEQHSYTLPMLAKFEQNNFSSELIVWLRGGHTYQWLSIEGSWALNNANSGATSVTNGYGNNTYYPTQTNDIGGLSKYYIGWSASRWSGTLATDTLGGSGNRAVYSDGGGTLTNSSSDVTLKTNIQNINYGLDSILSLRPVSYNWIEEKRGLQKEIGFIAQEVQEHIPEVIGINSDETLSLDYPKLTAVLTNAIKEQQEMINQLRTEIEILKNK